jgi:hypothetical protein
MMVTWLGCRDGDVAVLMALRFLLCLCGYEDDDDVARVIEIWLWFWRCGGVNVAGIIAMILVMVSPWGYVALESAMWL